MKHTLRLDAAAMVGRTPRSARVPLDPLLAHEITFIGARQADGGVGRGPGLPTFCQGLF
jgi:hypothetical protein